MRSNATLSASVFLLVVAFGCGGSSESVDRTSPTSTTPPVPPTSVPRDRSESPSPAIESGGGIDRSLTAGLGSDREGARALLSAFLDPKTDRSALTLALRPEPEDYAAVFTDDIAPRMQAGYEELWSGELGEGARSRGIAADDGQTELLLGFATGADFNARTPTADEFPGGYRDLRGKFRDDVVIFRWKFVKPGETIGMAFDGLAHVNGRWVWFPKPFRVLK